MMLLRLVSVSLLLRFTRGFSNVSIRPPCHDSGPTTLFANQRRRSFLSNLGGGVALIGLAQEAFASGGATAGGAYLLSVREYNTHLRFLHVSHAATMCNNSFHSFLSQAKQRYNERVEQGVSGFLGIKGALEGGDINAVRDWFSSEQVGGWKDFSAAGYLLANAFRRNSTTPPDSLPSVKVSW